jgi:hypothetical protein
MSQQPEEERPQLSAVRGKESDRLSVLGHLKERREQIKQSATTDLPVERWTDPEIFVRFKPVDHGIIRAGGNRVESAQPKDKARIEVEVNSDVLIRGCVGVFARINGKEYSLRPGDPRGDWTKFDADLAENLGLNEDSTAREVVKALYIFDGDIMSTAAKVAEFSGYRDKIADEEVSGES